MPLSISEMCSFLILSHNRFNILGFFFRKDKTNRLFVAYVRTVVCPMHTVSRRILIGTLTTLFKPYHRLFICLCDKEIMIAMTQI